MFQVFFRAGVLGQLEEIRDERVGKIMTWMQSTIRAFIALKQYHKLQEQRLVAFILICTVAFLIECMHSKTNCKVY